MDDNRKKALTAALGQIEKQFGKGSVMRLGDASASTMSRRFRPVRWASTSRSASADCRAAAWSRSMARVLGQDHADA
jgi:RecA/RadA recombinase